jgi:hypothetical protein
MLLLPALNAMFDIANTRYWATQMHPPVVIFALLIALALCCAVFAGYGMSATPNRNWLYSIGSPWCSQERYWSSWTSSFRAWAWSA